MSFPKQHQMLCEWEQEEVRVGGDRYQYVKVRGVRT